jgi:hypothetical protein
MYSSFLFLGLDFVFVSFSLISGIVLSRFSGIDSILCIVELRGRQVRLEERVGVGVEQMGESRASRISAAAPVVL